MSGLAGLAGLARFPGRGKRLAIQLALGLLVYVMSVNALVRAAGDGYPHLLSPRYMPQKTAALGALGLHSLGHLTGTHARAPRAVVREAARRHHVRADLLLAIARVESDLRPHRISHAGAMGMMQLMPSTASRFGVSDPFDPLQSALGAARFVSRLSRRYGGEPRRIAAAYNAGPGRVPRRGPMRLPAETRSYVRRVLKHMGARAGLASHPASPPG